MENIRKIIVIQSSSYLAGIGNLFWLFSRNQLELVLKEIGQLSASPTAEFCEGTIAWQDASLPVVNLEKYFGISGDVLSSPAKHLILKGARREGQEVRLSMVAVPIFAELKMGVLDFTGRTVLPGDILKTNSTDILGAFALSGDKFAVVPDICKIAERSRALLLGQEGA